MTAWEVISVDPKWSNSMSSSSSSGGGAYGPIDNISSGAFYLALVRLGDNATGGSVWELLVGADTTTHCSKGHRVWDPNLADGINSDWVTVSLNITTGLTASNASLSVGSDGASYSEANYSAITSVQIQASTVGVNGGTELRSITAVFTRANNSIETISVDQNSSPEANNSGSGTVAQAIEIRPSTNDFVAVSVTMQIRMSSLATTLPAADAMGAGIYVFAA